MRLVDEDVPIGEVQDPRDDGLGRHPLFQSFQTICIATNVLPVPVAIVSSSRLVASKDRRRRRG